LSTVSSAINSLAAVTWEDYIAPFLKRPTSPFVTTFVNKLLAGLYGLACIGLAFIASNFKGILQASLTVFGVVGGPLLGLFTLGMLFPFVSQRAAVPSFLLSVAFGLWIGFGGPKPPLQRLPGDLSDCAEFPIMQDMGTCGVVPIGNSTTATDSNQQYFYFYRISYMWYTLIGFSLTVILSCLLSLRWPETQRVPKRLLSPIIHRILNRTGYDYEDEISPQQDKQEEDTPPSPGALDGGVNNNFKKLAATSYTGYNSTLHTKL
jgi:sodium-coupled monocarboxylate transporter 8/12